LNRVFAPEGEFLSFARPKERNQRKGRLIAALILRSSILPGVAKRGLPAPLATRGIPAAPLTGNSLQNLRCSARQTGRVPAHTLCFILIPH
ncbi:MAG: hypothetical protein ACU83O_04255, partial [Gammaproteobacteria bacterium]